MIALGNATVNACATVSNASKRYLRLPPQYLAGLWRKRGVRVFNIQARFNRMTSHLDISLRCRQSLARRHAQLPLHQVVPGDHFSYRVLNLQARVHLQKIVLQVLVHDELHRACALVAHRQSSGYRIAAHGFAHGGVDYGRWRFLNDFLPSALCGAIALAQVNCVAVRVCKHLYFDMPAVVDQTLQHQGTVTKRAVRFAPRADDGLGHFTGLAHQSHAAPAPARNGFDQQGISELAGFTDQVLIILILTKVSRRAGNAGSDHAFLRQRFVSHGVNG